MTQDPLVNLNDAFGAALLRQFFEPILIGRGSNGEPLYAPSGVSLMAKEIFTRHGAQILEEVWERLDMEELAGKIAALVIADLTKVPGMYSKRNVHQENLSKRVQEIVAQALGQRVVDHMDLRIGTKQLDTNTNPEENP